MVDLTLTLTLTLSLTLETRLDDFVASTTTTTTTTTATTTIITNNAAIIIGERAESAPIFTQMINRSHYLMCVYTH